MKIGIIGGGMMGLATAFYLSQNGHRTTIFEKENVIGGLSRSQQLLPDLRWDRFYHVILSTDSDLLNFLDDLGLSPEVQFSETKTGFFSDGRLYSMSNTLEFLRFKPISLIDKVRLGAGIFYVSRLDNWKRLEKIYVKTWLCQIFGRRNYEKLWDPLLRSKLGSARKQASAAFIWATIKRLYGTRQKKSKVELMGCVKEGYFSIFEKIGNYLSNHGSKILTNQKIESVVPSLNGDVCLITSQQEKHIFDSIVITISNPEIPGILNDVPDYFIKKLKSVNYLGILCLSYVLKKSLTPFYITNIIDENIPLTGIIEATHIIPSEIIGKKALVYLPRYLPPGDPYWEMNDEEVFGEFTSVLSRMFPEFDHSDILAWKANREKFVQPIQDINYSQKIVDMKTPIKNVYLANTSMILNSTLNNNQVVRLAKKAANMVSEKV
jgi:protoporphyrinogen oxidase